MRRAAPCGGCHADAACVLWACPPTSFYLQALQVLALPGAGETLTPELLGGLLSELPALTHLDMSNAR